MFVRSVCDVTACVVVVVLLDIWNEGQFDDDNEDAERLSVSSHSEVAQLEDITGHRSTRAAEGADEIFLPIFADVSPA